MDDVSFSEDGNEAVEEKEDCVEHGRGLEPDIEVEVDDFKFRLDITGSGGEKYPMRKICATSSAGRASSDKACLGLGSFSGTDIPRARDGKCLSWGLFCFFVPS